jgi:hypothetical protein
MNDANTKKYLKALWAIAVCFLCVLFGAVGGGLVGIYMLEPTSTNDLIVALGDISYRTQVGAKVGSLVGLIVGIFLTARVWRWFNK